MCIYSHFQYLCLHEKIKIIRACGKAIEDSQGVLTCPDAPNPQAMDETNRIFGHRTYGVGVCSSIHCAWAHGILPLGDYGDNKRFGKSKSFEDDTEIEDSLAAREDRVGRWFRLPSADEQLDHFKTEHPLPEHELSAAGRALLRFPDGAAVIDSLDTLRWQELNPLYLTPAMLQWSVFHRLLPASVVDGRKSNTITPHKPILGPFKPQRSHKCPKKPGICKVCGENIGDKRLKKQTLSYRQNVALAALFNEHCAQGDPTGTMWDPNVELEWDDDKGEYRKVRTNFPVYDAPYPTSSNPAFVPSTTQAVDTTAVFGGQGVSLADGGTHANTGSGLVAGMDWDDFAMDASHDNLPADTYDDFVCTDDSIEKLQTLLDIKSSLIASASFGTGPHNTFTYAQPSELDNTMYQYPDNQSQLTNQFQTPQHDSNSFNSFTNQSEQNTLFSNQDPVVQAPDVVSSFFDDPMITCDSEKNSGGYRSTPAHPAGDFSAEQAMTGDQGLDGFSPETLNPTHQVLPQAFGGGVARPSDDSEANALFEQVLQYKRAGLV